jgi:NitT/TauT family transport system substrate-binding protein
VRNREGQPGRRTFLRGVAVVGATAVTGFRVARAAAEPALETSRVRLTQFTSGCQGPFHVAGELLHGEGFTDVQYIKVDNNQAIRGMLAANTVDVGVEFSAPFIGEVDRGADLVTLGGIHAGCFVLFGNRGVRAVRDLKGKTVSVPAIDGMNTARLYIATMAAYVGLDPAKDITWVAHPVDESTRLFAAGKIDAIMGFPPLAQELRARKIGHVVVDSTTDRPWSQYFCCMLASSRDYVRQHPVATKRVLRAILKAAEFCASEPARAAQRLVEDGFTPRYDYAHETLSGIPYDKWRDYDAEDSIRFYALRMHEAGLIKASPQKIIADGTDWRFLNELKRELKV